MRRLILIVAMLACASQRKQQREVLLESFDVETYTVDGATPADVRQAVARRGEPSATDWAVLFDYEVNPTPFHCTAIQPRVELKLWMHIPFLRDVPSATREACAADIEALRVHEDGHLAIDRETAHAVVELLRSAPAQANCDALRIETKHAVERILEEGRARNRTYDEQRRAQSSGCMP